MVDIWRIKRPFDELRKHVDWQIDEQEEIIIKDPKNKNNKNYTDEELQRALDNLKQYDIVWSSYYFSGMQYAFTKMVTDKFGTKFVLDCDDNVFQVDKDNPYILAVNEQQQREMMYMYLDAPHVVVTNNTLAHEFRVRRKQPEETVQVLPNFISNHYHHPEFDNGDKIVIGYFGGSSHYDDLHESGFLPALEKIMHEHKNVYFESCGMIIDKYLPKARSKFVPPQMGDKWLSTLFPSLNFDISVAPIKDTPFTRSKSNIKWQESAIMGGAFVGSKVGPYKMVNSGVDGMLCENEMLSWYIALKELVESKELRQKLVKNARARVEKEYKLENNWNVLKDIIERIQNAHLSNDVRGGRPETRMDKQEKNTGSGILLN